MNTKIYKEIADRGYITEREVNLCKNRINRGCKCGADVWDIFQYGNLDITPEQTEKGIKWLRDKWQTPRGVERKHNPFNSKQQVILKHFDKFQLVGFHDASDRFFPFYLPVYRVISKKGMYFDYMAWYSRKDCPITFLGEN